MKVWVTTCVCWAGVVGIYLDKERAEQAGRIHERQHSAGGFTRVQEREVMTESAGQSITIHMDGQNCPACGERIGR